MASWRKETKIDAIMRIYDRLQTSPISDLQVDVLS